MISLVTTGRSDFFTAQKANVSYSFFDSSFKYATIPIAEDLRTVCQLIPQQVPDDCCYASTCVVQYVSLPNLAPLCHGVLFDRHFRSSDVRVLDAIVDSKTVNVSVIMNKSASVQKWKSAGTLSEIVRDILQLFVVVSSCVVKVPWRKESETDIVFICVSSTGSRRNACRITSATVVNIEEIMSLDKFERRCTKESVEVVGLSSQLKFLNTVYQANVNLKKYRNYSRTKCIQKVLIIGPPGCGKTSLVNSFARSKQCGLVVVEGSQLTHVSPGESESILRSFFDEAVHRSQEGEEEVCIVHLDQVENICRKSKSAAAHLRRLSSQLFQILETIDEYPGIIVIATTSDVHSLDPVLRRSARIQTEIYIGMPNEKERQEILHLHSNDLKMATCKRIAACTVGYTGADLAFLVQNVNRLLDKDKEHSHTESDIVRVYEQCLRTHTPSAMRGGLGVVRLRDTQMSHLGGVDEAKSILERYIEWPLKYSARFRRMGIPVPKGVLLYGPPGCAKTSLVCAIANATNTTFLAVSAAELYSPYVGEAEKNVVELFHKARMNNPCILFIDEIDALVGNRETSSKSVQTKILSAFLTEMDGFDNKIDWSFKSNVVDDEDSEKVNTVLGAKLFDFPYDYNLKCLQTEENSNIAIVIAATNRPDKLDSALLRPGRFDKLIHVNLPSVDERLDILRTIVNHLKIPLSSCVDLREIAEKTEHFSGADLKSLMNEAGYKALLRGGISTEYVKHEHILESLSVVLASGSKDSYSQHFEQFGTG